MSGYWGATSGTALVFQKEEVKDFFTRYLLETYRKGGVTDEDIDSIDCMISDYGSSFCFLRSAHRQSLLENFHSLESCVNEGSTAKHKKELFDCVEYCEEECSGGIFYPFKEPAHGKFVDVEDGSCIIYTDKSTRPQGKFITDNSVSKVVIPPELYQYSQDSTGLTAALEQCRKYPGSSLKQFITKNISTIFYNLITSPTSSNGEEIMVSLIKDGVFTEAALKKLLKEIEEAACKENLITLKAYILDAIKPKNNTFKI